MVLGQSGKLQCMVRMRGATCVDSSLYRVGAGYRYNSAMITWQVAVIATGILSGVAQSIGKRQVSRMSAFQSGVLRDGTILLVVAVVSAVQHLFGFAPLYLLFVGVGILESVMQAAYYSASREEMAGTVVFSYPLSSLLIVLSSGFLFSEWGYFDPRSGRGLLNIAALCLTLFLVFFYQKRDDTLTHTKRFHWSVKLLASALMVVVANLAVKWAVAVAGVKPASYMFWEYLGLLFGGLVFVYARGQDLRVGRRQVVWGIVQGTLFAASVFWYATLRVTVPLSLSSIVRRVAIVTVTTLAGLFVFGEHKRITSGQWVSLALGFGVLAMLLAV